ncbi:MAG: hypothetical protein D3916_04740 [Candidatus Electrothrix sp. MAN1_4]|nr:hypothetical protein [Candidatus Electrothrix sp. MAN1_4]
MKKQGSLKILKFYVLKGIVGPLPGKHFQIGRFGSFSHRCIHRCIHRCMQEKEEGFRGKDTCARIPAMKSSCQQAVVYKHAPGLKPRAMFVLSLRDATAVP